MMPSLDDLDHELSQLMKLHREMRTWRWRLYPKTIKRAADLAYAAHMRVLLEFFRNGRLNLKPELKRIGCPDRNDLVVSELDRVWTGTTWTDDELGRLCDADKLLGHLSKDRRHRTSDWGRDADWDLMRGHVDRLFSSVTSGLDEAQKARRKLT